MNDVTLAAWIIAMLAELLLLSAAVNVIGLRRRWWQKARGMPHAVLHCVEAVIDKGRVVRDLYRRSLGEAGEDMPALLEHCQTEAKQLEDLLREALDALGSQAHLSEGPILQPLLQDIAENGALLRATTEALLGRGQQLQQLMAQADAQERLLQELTERSTTYQTELEDLARQPPEGESTSEVLQHLQQRYLLVQQKLQELLAHREGLQACYGQPTGGLEHYRDLFELMRTLKLENLRLTEEVRSHAPRLQWLKDEKARLERDVEQLKSWEEAYRAEQRKARQLELQLERTSAEILRLKSELRTITNEYLKLFEQHRS